jgi:hypothetical protein
MAVNEQQETILAGMLSGLTNEQKQALASASTEDLAAAAARLITTSRGQSMGQVVASLVTGSVANWPALEAAADVADGATVYAALDAFNASMEANGASLIPDAVWVALALRKHLQRT